MRILFLVLLSIAVLVGAGLGGVSAWSATKGPMSEKVADLAKAAEAAREVGKLTNQAVMAGKSADEAGSLIDKGLRAYRVVQFGGAAIALINIALLVLAIKRNARGILVVGGIGAVVGIVCFALNPGRQIDEGMFYVLTLLGGSAIAAALFAYGAGRPKPAPALQ